jgi:hypothetical protein
MACGHLCVSNNASLQVFPVINGKSGFMDIYSLTSSIRRIGLLLSIGLATLPLAGQAKTPLFIANAKPPPTVAAGHANPLLPVANVNPPPISVAMASAATQCIALTYDKNGNRLVQTVTSMATTTTIWGAAPYGCFVWKP